MIEQIHGAEPVTPDEKEVLLYRASFLLLSSAYSCIPRLACSVLSAQFERND